MRQIYRQIIDKAFKAGVENAWSFWDMTPAEINGRMTAHHENQFRILENIDKLAWLTGMYTARGLNDPDNFPDAPDMINRADPDSDEAMSENTMKSILTSYAEIHNAIEEVKPK